MINFLGGGSEMTSNGDIDDKKPLEKDLKSVEEMETGTEKSSERDKENHLIDTTQPLNKEAVEETTFRVIYNKNKYDVSFPLNLTVMELKTHLQSIIGKLFFSLKMDLRVLKISL